MPRKVRLRTRVYAATALYMAVLLAVTFVLTWRARETQVALREVMTGGLSEAAALEEIIRLQRDVSRAIRSPESTPDPARYASVREIAATGIGGSDGARLNSRIEEFDQILRQSGDRETLARFSDSLVRDADRLLTLRRQRLRSALPELERRATATMWAALAIAYMIGVAGFVVARVGLARVVRPIENLSHAADALADGDLKARAPVAGDREVAALGHAFNRMASALAQSHDDLAERARTDDLTRLPNFRAFREAIDAEIDRSSRYQQSFGVLVFDLDHFKSYNDEYGHLAGNEALQAAAEAIRSALRTVDFLARYGGEEFAAIAPRVERDALKIVAERIRREVESIPPIASRRSLTVSVGGAIYPVDGTTADELFAVADARLYDAKHMGRNRVVIESGTPSAASVGM